MDEENTKRAKLEHLGDFKLVSKSGGISVSRKTKNATVDTNSDASKIIHQNHNGINQLTKKLRRMKVQI